jgi:flagellar biosynthetic protein FliP
VSDQPGAFRVMLMGVNMTVPMVVWMRIRGHSALRNLEMAASMMVPTGVAAVLVWAGALDVMAGLGVQHAVMVPAMLGVMLWRYDEYAHAHRGRHG